ALAGLESDALPLPPPFPWWPEHLDQAAVLDQLHRWLRLATRGRARALELPMRHRDGRVRWMAVTIAALPADPNGTICFVGTVRDVTDQRAAAATLAARTRFSAALAAAPDERAVLRAGVAELATSWPHGTATVIGWDASNRPAVLTDGGDRD